MTYDYVSVTTTEGEQAVFDTEEDKEDINYSISDNGVTVNYTDCSAGHKIRAKSFFPHEVIAQVHGEYS